MKAGTLETRLCTAAEAAGLISHGQTVACGDLWGRGTRRR